MLDCDFRIDVSRHDAAGLRTGLTQDSCQLASVNIRNRDSIPAYQKIRKAALVSPAAGNHRAIADDQTRGLHPG